MGFSAKKHFWVWFQQNSEIYRCIDQMAAEEAQYWMDEIEAHLRTFVKNIYPAIGLPQDGTATQFIISAHGNQKYFKRVEEFVSKAPTIPGWEIVAFLPPRPIDCGISAQYGHTGIDPHNLWFNPYFIDDFDERPAIVVFAEGCADGDPEFTAAVEAVIANLLGERSAVLDLLGVSVDNMDGFADEVRAECMKLQELPAYLERVYVSSCFINERGEMEMKAG